MIKKMDKKGAMAISQIIILMVGIIAFSYALGDGMKIVSADFTSCSASNVGQVDGKTFCYGGSYSQNGQILTAYHVYTATGQNTLKDDRGVLYKLTNGVWQYYSSGQGTYVNLDLSKNNIEIFSNLATQAINSYIESTKTPVQETKTNDCPTECITRGYSSGACETLAATALFCSNGIPYIGGSYCVENGFNAQNYCCCSREKLEEDKVSTTGLGTDFGGAGSVIGAGSELIKDKEETPTTPAGDFAKAPVIGGTAWWNYLLGHIIEGAGWAVAIGAANTALKSILPEEYQSLSDAYAYALMGAVVTGKTAIGITEAINPATRAAEGELLGSSTWIGLGVAAAYFMLAFRYETYETITFECQPWDAPTGGSRCEDCNDQGILPCSEYQCKSLGQACEIVNKGTDQEKCAWVGREDARFPVIEASEEDLISDDYVYTPDNAISPPDRGVKIEYTPSTTGCVPAFTPLSFGIKLDEPGKCKFDTSNKKDFDEMNFYFSNGLLLEDHSYALSLPGAGGDVEIENDGEHSLYVKCEDANGNSNTANFVFNFCVEQGPDTTPPLVVQTSIINGFPIAYNQTNVDLEVYINEPVTGCKWSKTDQTYENMENDMNCVRGNQLTDINRQGLYTCETNLDGLKNREENNFYFRCEDLSGNVNSESYNFQLVGSQPLVIDSIKPEEGSLIKDSTERVTVTLEAQTSAGYKEGESNCYFSDTGDENDYVQFFNTGSYQHSQDLQLSTGNYNYFIKCVDLGGNYDIVTVNFDVESDANTPLVVRAYHEESYLKLITSEPARCVYDTKYESYPCDYAFDDGTPLNVLEDINHYTTWNPQETLYIKCEDQYGNQPVPDVCSIIVRPSDLY